jgi:hypothetical protein
MQGNKNVFYTQSLMRQFYHTQEQTRSFSPYDIHIFINYLKKGEMWFEVCLLLSFDVNMTSKPLFIG